ncbi:MAG: ATP-grasp domain-containing protein [Bacillota bacterium]
MSTKILTEASGSLTSAYLIEAIKKAGFFPVASDIDPECVGRYLAHDFIEMPSKDDKNLWEKTLGKLISHKIDIVIPSLDETLLGWAQKKEEFLQHGVHTIISNPQTVKIFQDKWLTFQFFRQAGIPTPLTSLEQKYPLIKPRNGRGSKGVKITSKPVHMDGMVSQELLEGEEYTVDVFCDKQSEPVYIVPRKRLGVKDGKSTGGIVVNHPQIIKWVKRICKQIPFLGPINIQCFICKDGSVKFVEINPRIAGGMALGFAATENWINLIVDHFIFGKTINPKPIRYGMKMKRYYAEVFIP